MPLTEAIETHGPVCSPYIDPSSHYRRTPEAGGKADKHNPIQFIWAGLAATRY